MAKEAPDLSREKNFGIYYAGELGESLGYASVPIFPWKNSLFRKVRPTHPPPDWDMDGLAVRGPQTGWNTLRESEIRTPSTLRVLFGCEVAKPVDPFGFSSFDSEDSTYCPDMIYIHYVLLVDEGCQGQEHIRRRNMKPTMSVTFKARWDGTLELVEKLDNHAEETETRPVARGKG